ncbi:MAG: hypothetical protein AAF631_03385 [Pseudomonadota bacterium]
MAETALPEYTRLESLGLWREGPGAQRREVIVSFGAASLVLSDANGKPLTHWSLAAIRIRNPGQLPAIYAPDQGSGEALEIEDEAMVDAITRVRAANRRRAPHPGRLRWWLRGGLTAAVLALAVFWLPGVSADYATRVLPSAKAEEIGEAVLAQAARLTGRPCANVAATDALHRFERWLLPGGGRVHVVDLGSHFSAHLPGGHILIDRTLLEDHAGPEVAAGFVLMEQARNGQSDPMRRLFRHIGTRATLTFLATGKLPDNALAAFARSQLTSPGDLPPDAALLAAFATAELTSAPFARALNAPEGAVAGLIAGDPARSTYRPGMTDADWVTLQSICGP